MHASSADEEDVPHIPLAMPSGSVKAFSIAAPEPLVRIEEPETTHDEDEPLPPPAPPRWTLPHYIIAVSLAVLVVSVSLTLLRDRELVRTAQAKRARAAVTALANPAPPATQIAAAPQPAPMPSPSPSPELAAIAAASATESAKAERFEAQVALEIGDIVRAERVAQHAVLHDPTDADGWLLLTAAQLELNQVEASRASLKSCTEKATHGAHWECAALMRDNGP